MRSDVRRSIECTALVGLATFLATTIEAQAAPPTGYEGYKDRPMVRLKGTFRDVSPAKHEDFGKAADSGAGRYIDMFADELDAKDRPTFGSTGRLVQSDWQDVNGNNIIPPRSYISSMPGDKAGSVEARPGGAITSAGSLASWYTNVPAVNTTVGAPLTLNRSGDRYVFDGTLDSIAGPADYDYTYEVDTMFVYERGGGWDLTVETDAEAWVYIDNRLVIDGGAGGPLAGAATDLPNFCVDWRVTARGAGNRIDGYDSTAGAYGGGNAGLDAGVSSNTTTVSIIDLVNTDVIGDVLAGPGAPVAAVTTVGGSISGHKGTLDAKVPIPTTPMPSGLPGNAGDVSYSGGTHVINTDLHCDAFIARNGARVQITRDVNIYCEESFWFRSGSELSIMPGGSLTVYVRGNIMFDGASQANTGGDPSQFAVYHIMPDMSRPDPLNLYMLNHPDVMSGFINVTYTAATDQLLADGVAMTLDHDGDNGTPALPITSGAFHIDATVDDTGRASMGSLRLTGAIGALGIPDGTLLRGDLIAYGSTPAGGGGLNEFIFQVTGGSVASRYGTRVSVILSQTDFAGDYTSDWQSGLYSAVAGTAPGSHIFGIIEGSRVVARAEGPGVHMRIDDADYFGTFLGHAAELRDGGRFHVDVDAPSGGGGSVPMMAQTIDLDRLGSLEDRRTYDLKIFVANRFGQPTAFRLETSIPTLRLARMPSVSRVD